MKDSTKLYRMQHGKANTSTDRDSIENSLIYYILISLFCVNFLKQGSAFCFVFGIYAVVRIKEFKFDICSLFCFILSFAAFIVAVLSKDIVGVFKCWNFFLMYLIGANGYYNASDKKKYITRVSFSIFFGYALYIFVSYFFNLNMLYSKEQRSLIDFWSNKSISVTLVGLMSSVVIGYFAYVLFCPKKYILKIITMAVCVLVIVINSKTATRTPILLLPIVIGCMFVVFLFNQNWHKALQVLFWTLIVAVLTVVFISFDLWGIKTYIKSTFIFKRFQDEGIETGRVQIVQLHLTYFFDYMWGGGHIEAVTGWAAHNFLQQGHDLYGIFATISLVLITVCMLRNFCKLVVKREKKEIDFLFISMYLSMLIQACLEPIFTGYPCFYFSLLLLHGLATSYVNNDLSRSKV